MVSSVSLSVHHVAAWKHEHAFPGADSQLSKGPKDTKQRTDIGKSLQVTSGRLALGKSEM